MRTSGLLAIVLLSLLVVVMSGCAPAAGIAAVPTSITTASSAQQQSASYRNISVSELATMMEAKDFVLINAHETEGDIPQTDLWITYDRIGSSVDLLPQDKDGTIVVYCRSGNKSQAASQALVDLGYTNVLNVQGGIMAWRQAGYAEVPR